MNKLTQLAIIPENKNNKELAIIPETNTNLSIYKQWIKKNVWNVMDFETKKKEILELEKKAYEISIWIAEILNLPVWKLELLKQEHDKILSWIADDYKEQKAA